MTARARRFLLVSTLGLSSVAAAALGVLSPQAALAQGRAGGETEEEKIFAEAEKLFDAGRYADAAPLYDKALSLNPTRPATLVKRATLYFRERRYDQAIQLLSRAEKLAPGDLNLKTVLGLCLYQSGQRERGLSYLSEVAARRPETYEAQLQLGEHYAQTDPPRAIAALAEYFRYRPEEQRDLDGPVQLLLGTAYFQSGRLPEAQKALEAAFRQRPQDVRTRLTLGAVVLAQGDFQRAVTLHEPLQGLIKQRPRIAYNLALAYLKLGRLRDAARLASEYAALRQRDPLGPLLLGDIALAGGSETDARAALRSYAEADRLNVLAAGSASGQASGQPEPLRLSLDSRNVRAYSQAHEPARAIAIARARLERLATGQSPKAAEEGELLAGLLEAQLQLLPLGQAPRPETPAWAARLAQLYPSQAEALALAGSGALSAGDLEHARTFYEQSRLHDSKSRRARLGLSRTLIRLAAQELGAGDNENEIPNPDRVGAAVPLLEQALRLDETAIAARDLAVVYLMLGRYAAAEQALAPLLAGAGRGDPLLLRLRARAQLGEKQPAAALTTYERAVSQATSLLAAAVAAGDKSRQKVLTQQLGELNIELSGRYLAAGKLDDAVNTSDKAARELFGAAGLPESGGVELLKAGLRNQSLAYLLRGRARLAEFEAQPAPPGGGGIKLAEGALEDLQHAVEHGGLLPGKAETGTALCAASLAATQATRYALARALLKKAQDEGSCAFQPPFERLGHELLSSYISYRDTGSPAQREAALRNLARLQGRGGAGQPDVLRTLLRSLLHSGDQMLAYDYFAQGKLPKAMQLLRAAQKSASAGPADSDADKNDEAVLTHNLAVAELSAGHAAAERTLERLGAHPVEALVNLGILHDRRGQQKKALELYRRALEHGARTPRLREWIAAKERLYGDAP